MEYIPSFRDSLYVDTKPSYLQHAMTEDEFEDKKFGLPRIKKYPMPDAAHVRSAIKFFNYVTPANEKELARNILARMDEYGIDPDDINVGDNNRFKKYIKPTVLAHHGIKGMHWGVRRYQNADGSLTPAGKKRYYHKETSIIGSQLTSKGRKTLLNKDGTLTDAGKKLFHKPNGELTADGRHYYYSYDGSGNLSKAGYEFNERATRNADKLVDSTLYNVKRTDPAFNKKLKRYKELERIGSEQYRKNHNDWLKEKDFKDLDYDEFKDSAHDRWGTSSLGKEQINLQIELRKSLDNVVKDHPLYSKNIKTLKYFNSNVYDEQHGIKNRKPTSDYETQKYGDYVVRKAMAKIMYDVLS